MPNQEAQRIYSAIFAQAVPPPVAARFATASEALEADVASSELRAYRAAIESGADLEALELAARWTRRLPLLTRKFQLMAFLAETLPENQALFINRTDSFAPGFVRIVVMTARTGWLMVKGLPLARRYGVGGAR